MLTPLRPIQRTSKQRVIANGSKETVNREDEPMYFLDYL
jgi:hypothetical protein